VNKIHIEADKVFWRLETPRVSRLLSGAFGRRSERGMYYEVIGLGLIWGLFLGTGLGYCSGGLIGSWRRVPRADRDGAYLGLVLGSACAVVVGFLMGAHRDPGVKDVLLYAPLMAVLGGCLGGVLGGFRRRRPEQIGDPGEW